MIFCLSQSVFFSIIETHNSIQKQMIKLILRIILELLV